jgi:hypothetical protein
MELSLRVLSTTIGEVGLVGLACLFALHVADRNVSEDELLATVHVESISTLRRHLNFCAMHEYASMVKRSVKQSALWHITDIGKAIVLRVISLFGLPGGLPIPADTKQITAPGEPIREKNFFSAPSSSSSDQIDLSQSESDQNQIEEEEERAFKRFLCTAYGLTGDRAEQVIADQRIYAEDICAWMWQVRKMERGGFKFRKSSAAYALGCLLKDGGPDRAPKDAEYGSKFNLDQCWGAFQRARAVATEENADATPE